MVALLMTLINLWRDFEVAIFLRRCISVYLRNDTR